MRDSASLYLKSILLSARAQMQYRTSFVLSSIAQFLVTGVEFFAIWALFHRFGSLEGWQLGEVALLYGMTNISFALGENLAYGFNEFDQMVKSGEFDRVLLRPRGTAFQIASRQIRLRTGRLLQGIAVFIYALWTLDVALTLPKTALLLAALASGVAMFTGLFILRATLTFFTIEALEVMAIVTYGGVETTQYPITIYDKWFRRFFTFVIPLACMNYFPALAITGRADPLGTPVVFQWLAPLVGFAFLALCLRAWQFGVRRYRSTGS